jgi:hypothetical protein
MHVMVTGWIPQVSALAALVAAAPVVAETLLKAARCWVTAALTLSYSSSNM